MLKKSYQDTIEESKVSSAAKYEIYISFIIIYCSIVGLFYVLFTSSPMLKESYQEFNLLLNIKFTCLVRFYISLVLHIS